MPESFKGEVVAQASGLDGLLILDCPVDECERRATGRRIDPQTSIIYHLEDNPAPEDSKNPIADRLTEVDDEVGNTTRLNRNNAQYDAVKPALEAWTSSFGLSQDGKCAV